MTLDERTRTWLAERWWREDDVLLAARERFAATGPLIEVPAETGALLGAIVRIAGARRVLEIGTLFGYSAAWLARALPADGHLDTLELDDAHADAAERLFAEAGLSERVTVHRGAALETLATLAQPYDMAFIDADKAGYPDYVEHAVRLVRRGGVILCDNLAQDGRVADPGCHEPNVVTMRRVHDLLAAHPALDSTVLPIGDGVSVSIRR